MVNSVLNVAITKNFHWHENWPTDDEVWEKQLHVVWFIWSGFLARNTHHLAFLSALPYAIKALIFVHWIILEGVEQWTDLLSQVYFITFQKLSPTEAIFKKMGLPSRILKWKGSSMTQWFCCVRIWFFFILKVINISSLSNC